MRLPSLHRYVVLLLLLLIFAAHLRAQSNTGLWQQLPVPLSPGGAYGFIDFSDSLHGWVMSPDRYFSTTTDGGQTWQGPHMAGDSGTVHSMKWLGGDSAIVAIQIGTSLEGTSSLLHTTDRGRTWVSSPLPVGRTFSSKVSLLNRSLIGYVSIGLGPGAQWLCTSTDLGSTWRVDSLPNAMLRRTRDIGILSADQMIFCSGVAAMEGDGMIVRSADFGKSCTSMVSQSNLTSSQGRFMTSELSYFSYGWGDEYPRSGYFAYNAVLDSCAGMPVNSMGALFRDGSMFTVLMGSTMTARSPSLLDSTYTIAPYPAPGIRIADMVLLSPQHGWLLDQSGRIFRSLDLLTAVPDQPTDLPERFGLLQNYPNPFNPRTTVRYTLPSDGMVDLRVTDVLGREVYRVVENEPAGIKSRPIDLSRCASGVYFCTVRFNGRAQTIRMALVW